MMSFDHDILFYSDSTSYLALCSESVLFPRMCSASFSLAAEGCFAQNLDEAQFRIVSSPLKNPDCVWSHLKIGRSLPLHWHNGSNRQKDLFNSSSFLFDDNKSELFCSLSVFIHQTKQERCGPDAE